MASVPVLNPLDQIASRPAPAGYQSDAGATPAAFGAGTGQTMASAGQGLQKLGDAGIDIATQQQQEDNTLALKKADVVLADKIRTIQYGDGTAQNPGYFSQRGDTAVSNAASTMAAIKQAHADTMSSLPNAHTQALFSSIGGERVVSAQQSVGSFIDQQRLVANVGASVARQETAINDTAADWNNPQTLAKNLAVIRGEATAQGQLQGWSPDEVKAKGDAEVGRLFANTIKAAGRSGDYAAAQKIFDDNLDSIPGSMQGPIERELRTDQRNARIDAQLADAEGKKAEAARQQKIADGIWDSMVGPNGITVPPNLLAQAKDAGLKWQTAHALASSAEALATRGAKLTDDPGTFKALISGATIPEGQPGHKTPTDVYAAVGAGDLSIPSANFIIGGMKPENLGDTVVTKNAIEGAVAQLVPGYVPGAPTAAGAAIEGRLYPYVYKALQDGKAAGKSTNSMLTPGNKDYILGPDVLQHIAKPQGDDVTGPNVFQNALSTALNYVKSFQQPAAAKADPLGAPTTGALVPKQAAKTNSSGVPLNGRPSLDDIFGGK